MGKAESASCHATSWLLSMTSFAQLRSDAGLWRRESAGCSPARRKRWTSLGPGVQRWRQDDLEWNHS